MLAHRMADMALMVVVIRSGDAFPVHLAAQTSGVVIGEGLFAFPPGCPGVGLPEGVVGGGGGAALCVGRRQQAPCPVIGIGGGAGRRVGSALCPAHDVVGGLAALLRDQVGQGQRLPVLFPRQGHLAFLFMKAGVGLVHAAAVVRVGCQGLLAQQPGHLIVGVAGLYAILVDAADKASRAVMAHAAQQLGGAGLTQDALHTAITVFDHTQVAVSGHFPPPLQIAGPG
ncbi:hypothetical protein [Grimontia celer]|uniref:hypothetical protein n=1 Tax=Grimontia celer TaxID=1796497 RepID=UPI001E62B299|nr:hypothetical protein [Grimontia celer]